MDVKIVFTIIIISFIVSTIILLFRPFFGLDDVLTGKTGLEKILKSNVIDIIIYILVCLPYIIMGVFLIIIFIVNCDSILNAIWKGGIVLIVAAIFPVIFFPRGQFQQQLSIKQLDSVSELYKQVKKDIDDDQYESYTVNDCEISMDKYSDILMGSGAPTHNEYTASFFYNNDLILEAQVGEKDAGYFKEQLPYGFDTHLTVYKGSGFIRSIDPSVSYKRSESIEHFFTISYSGNDVVYIKNTDKDVKYITCCVFKKGQSDNRIKAVTIADEYKDKCAFDLSVIDKEYDEICLYACVDGVKGINDLRVSNILSH